VKNIELLSTPSATILKIINWKQFIFNRTALKPHFFQQFCYQKICHISKKIINLHVLKVLNNKNVLMSHANENDTFGYEIYTHACRFSNIFLIRHAHSLPEHTPDCDFNTHKCGFCTQSVIFTRLSVISARKVRFSHEKCDFDTQEHHLLIKQTVLLQHVASDFKTNQLKFT
jgi:hypothetical protein